MNCQRLLQIHRRVRVARASALGGQCTMASRSMKAAGREFARAKADGATTTNACARALAKGVGQFLTASRRQIREQCDQAGGGH